LQNGPERDKGACNPLQGSAARSLKRPYSGFVSAHTLMVHSGMGYECESFFPSEKVDSLLILFVQGRKKEGVLLHRTPECVKRIHRGKIKSINSNFLWARPFNSTHEALSFFFVTALNLVKIWVRYQSCSGA